MPVDGAHRHPDTKTDRQLLDEARGGHGESFEVVYRRHHAVVLTFLEPADERDRDTTERSVPHCQEVELVPRARRA